MKALFGILIGIVVVIGAALAALMLRFRRNQQRADEAWARFEPQPLDLEPVEGLTITPLVDARTASEALAGESGVSLWPSCVSLHPWSARLTRRRPRATRMRTSSRRCGK